MIPTPVYWKLDRIVLAATTEDGNVYEPALVFPHVQELTQALYELTEILPPDDTLRRTASPASPEEVLRAQMEVVELVAIHPQSECLLWLDPAKNPRIELAGDRPRRTLLDGFISWISTKAGMQPVPDYLQALMVMFRHSVQQRKLSEDSSQPANTTEPAATEPTATPMDTTEPVAAAPVTEPPTAPSPTQADSLLPVVSTTTVDTPMVVAAPSPEENHDTNAQVGKKRAQRTSPRKTSQASPRKVAPDVKTLVRIPLKSRKQGPFDKDYVSTQTAKTILKKAGFGFSHSGVSLPDKSQTFADEDELRHFLRQHGAPEFADCDQEDKKAIEGWIRQSLMRSGEFNGGFPKYYLEFSNYRDMQTFAGFQWQKCSLGNVYMYPHVDAKQTLHPFMDFVFASEPELILSLAKNGFPDYLYEKLSKEEMLGLEVFVDSWAYEKLKRNLFEQRQQETVHDASPGKRKTRSALHQDTKEASVASPPKKLRNGKSISPSKGTKAKASAGYHTPTKPTARGKTEFSTPTTAVTTMSTMTTEASVDALPWPPVMDAAASIGGATNRERLSNVISSLRESTQAPVFAENSSLAKNIKKIRDMIHTVIRSTGRHGGTVPRGRPECKALYVCGVPGTGKTMSISWLCQYLLQLHKDGSIGVERDDDDEEVDWKFLMLNNNSNVNSIAINDKIRDALKLKRGGNINYKLKSTGLILVLDEMDSMLDLKDKRELLKKLTGYANDPENRFILIGISNSLMNNKFARMQEIGQVRSARCFALVGLVQDFGLTRLFLAMYSFVTPSPFRRTPKTIYWRFCDTA